MTGSTVLLVASPLLLLAAFFALRRVALGIRIEVLESRALERWHLLPLSAKRDVLLALAHQAFTQAPSVFEYSLRKFAAAYREVPTMDEIELNRRFLEELRSAWRRPRKELRDVRAGLEAAFERRRELAGPMKEELGPTPSFRPRLTA